MVIDPNLKKFVLRKDPVQPDKPTPTPPPHRFWTRTRQKRHISSTSPPPPPITSNYAIIYEFSTIVNSMHIDAMETLHEYFREEIRNIQIHITINLKSALQLTVQRLQIRKNEKHVRLQKRIVSLLYKTSKTSKTSKTTNTYLTQIQRKSQYS